jgi:Glycosyl hydrolases family 31/PA14 domain/Domain of unknown function (DUF5110)
MKKLIPCRIGSNHPSAPFHTHRPNPVSKILAGGLIAATALLADSHPLRAADYVVGSVRVQCLSGSLVRLEAVGPNGFENRETFHVVNRNWPGTACTSNLVSGEVRIGTTDYTVHVPAGATSLAGIYLTSPAGQILFQGSASLTNSLWLPGPSDNPVAWSFADSPRLIPPAWGLTPAPVGAPSESTSGWVTNNNAPDVYVFVPNGSYTQLRKDFLRLTGPTEMIPLYALGMWDSRYYNYSEATALQEIDDNRSRRIPQDVMVIDTGWRVNASIGYEPNTDLFPDPPRFFSEAHAKNTRVVFNDHPEPEGTSALDPTEVTYRYTNLVQLISQGLDVWWYDRNWSSSIFSPASNLRKEVWGMKIYNDTAVRANPTLRPLIMANADGIDNGIRSRPPNVAAHRYSIQWTGDTYDSLHYLNLGIQNAVHAGIHWTYPYLSEDLGGHNGNTAPGDYLRWIEYGALSPIYRPHCTMGLARMPWTFGSQAEWVARRYLNMRYRLLPEFYAAAHNNYETGEPILRRLDLDYPQYAEASQNHQYLITHSLLIAPVTSGGMSTVPASWLTTTNGQPGLQAAYFDNEDLSGSPALSRTDANIDFNWGNGSPGGTVGIDHFSVRWTGNITVPAAVGDITLAATSDDGVRVWVNGQLCIGNWGANNSSTTESAVALKAGQSYQLRVEFLELTGNAIMSLKWRSHQSPQTVWIPPGNWINAWNGSVLKGPATDIYNAPPDQIPLYIRSGSIFALAPEMQHTAQLPWSPVTLDVYPSATETDQTSLYEDDTLTMGYKQGQFRTTAIKIWANDAAKTVSVSIDAAVGTFPGALSQRSWVLRLRRPPSWTSDLTPTQVTLNGQSIGPVLRRIKNATAMPLGDEAGAPDAEVFEVTVPASSVFLSNFIVATFASDTSGWVSRDIGNVGAHGNAVGGLSVLSNSVCMMRGSGAGIGGTNDGFHFMHQPSVGNVQLTTRLVSQQSLNTNAEAGIMISESLQRSARCAVMALKPGNYGVFQNRSTNDTAAQTVGIAGLSTPRWLRLVRSGNTFSGYASSEGTIWNMVGSATISGFSSNAYVGLVVSAGSNQGANNGATNATGTVITGVSSGLQGGLLSADDTNLNVAVFGNVALNTPIHISSIPNQTTLAATATAAIPLIVTSSGGGALTLTAQSSDTSVLPVGNILFSGSGANRSITLTPTAVGGKSTVTVTASEGSTSASTEFTLTVLSLSTSRELLQETFTGYSAGNIVGQTYHGTGFTIGSWIGRNNSFAGSANDAAQFSASGLSFPALQTAGGKITVKGDGSNLQGLPDLSVSGAFASAALCDAASGTIGGGNVGGTLYVRFLMRAVSANHNGEYGGLHLSRGTDDTGVLIGNAWNALAFSLDYTPTSTEVDLRNNSGTGAYLFVDNNVHLIVAKITYAPGGDDTLTVWLDPNVTLPEAGQNSAATYVGSVTGDLSFDRFFLRGGNNHQFEYDEIKFGTAWSSVLPVSNSVSIPPPAIPSSSFVAENTFGFFFQGSPGLSYSVLTTSNLSPANWQTVSSGTFGFDSVLFNEAITMPQRFYRVSVP